MIIDNREGIVKLTNLDHLVPEEILKQYISKITVWSDGSSECGCSPLHKTSNFDLYMIHNWIIRNI